MADKRIPGFTIVGTKPCCRCQDPIYRYKESPATPDYCMDCWEIVEEEKYWHDASRRGLAVALGPGEAVFDGAW